MFYCALYPKYTIGWLYKSFIPSHDWWPHNSWVTGQSRAPNELWNVINNKWKQMIYPASQPILCSVYATAVNVKNTPHGCSLYFISHVRLHFSYTVHSRLLIIGHEQNDLGWSRTVSWPRRWDVVFMDLNSGLFIRTLTHSTLFKGTTFFPL